ncbi:Cupin domain protein [uncultured archaeon]|nr:Cupin domain protein [uncultured archaeon]
MNKELKEKIIKSLKKFEETLTIIQRGLDFLIFQLILFPLLFIPRFILEWAVESASLTLQIIIITIFFCLMVFLIWVIATTNNRAKFIERIQKSGIWAVVYPVWVLFISIYWFTSLFYLLYENGLVDIKPIDQGYGVTFSKLQDFFLWHFLEAIPVFNVPDTLLFKNPYIYIDHLSGWLLLAFKVVVIAPIIATILIAIESRKQPDTLDFKTMQLTGDYYSAPDGSEIRKFMDMNRGGLAHCTLPPEGISIPVAHKTVEEIWFFIQGNGQVWRKQGDREEVVDVDPGTCLTIPTGTHFQFRNTGSESLSFIIATMPPWPGKQEAVKVQKGYWELRR